MGFKFLDVERVRTINAEDFYKRYVKTQKPVVIEQLTKDWPAYEKWRFDYIKDVAGDQIVPLYNNDPVDYNKKVNEPDARMPMREYIEQLTTGRTNLRIFLFNLMKSVPVLRHDFKFPDLKLKLLKGMPMLFFGGKGVNVFMHFDIDNANILHFHFDGEKRCILVPPEQSKFMYKIPYAVICREDINFDEPDFEKWPALRYITPYVADLKHGEMLYMPEGYWHYMKYTTPGFSMSLRAMATKPKNLVNAFYNIFIARYYDNWMRKRKGAAWLEEKNQRAISETDRNLTAG